MNIRLLTMLVLALAALTANAQTLVIRAGTVYTAGPDGVINDAVVVVEDGKISAVGPANRVRVPGNATELQAAVVTPGLIDARTTVGLSGAFNVPADQDHEETTDPNTAHLRALDGYNPADPLVAYVRSLGVTTVQASPGEGNPVAGQAGVFKTAGRTVDDAALVPVSAMVFNLGEAPKDAWREKDRAPYTRMAVAAIIRQALDGAQQPVPSDAPPDLKRQALEPVVDGALPAIFTAHREDDIATALRLCREFKLRCRIAYATEGYLARERLAEAGVPVIVGPALQRLENLQTYNASLENAALLDAAGIPIVFGTHHESYVPKNRVMLWEIAVAVANGLDPQRAIRAATIDAAKLLGVDKRIGSLERGKDADLVLYDGDPFEYTSHVTHVIVNGEVVSDTPR